MPGGQKSVLNLGHIIEIPKWSVWNCTYFFIVTEAFVLCFAQFR